VGWRKLVILKKSTVAYVCFLLLFILGFLVPVCNREPRFKIGEHYIYCNPRAKINPNKHYHLHLWDYNWSNTENKLNYRAYMKQAIIDFQKIYPNIQVELTLLDFLTGPIQLEQALKANNAPDIYCSAYQIPVFNFKRQIPVGPYLKLSEQKEYLSNILKMLDYQGVLCYFPRWVAPGLWIGNKTFIESTGLSVSKIQNNGWDWDDVASAQRQIPSNKYLLVGNLGLNGIFTQLTANSGFAINGNYWTVQGINATTDFLEMLIHQKAIPADCDQNLLGRFLGGQAMILAGIRPSMFNLIRNRLNSSKANWQPVLLPIPARNAGEASVLVENGVVAIYRNKRTAGDDHLTAAMKFGQFLSCYQQTNPWEQLLVYPATKEAFNKWLSNIMINADIFNKLAKHDIIKNFIPLNGYQERVYPVINDFIKQKITGAEVKEKLNP
jgi:hypothetical protein